MTFSRESLKYTAFMNVNRATQPPLSFLHKTLPRIRCLFLAVAVAGCSSVKTHVDKGQIKARTFSWLDTGTRPVPDFADNRKAAHALVQQAITRNLGTRGVTYVPTGGNITVAYLIVVGNNVATTSLNSYFGYTPDSEALVEKVHSQQTGSEASRGYLETGTLVIDVLDPATSKLLQRRSLQAPLLRDLPAEKRTERVQEIVDQTLRDLPISQ